MFDPDVPNSDKPLVESIISTADDSFIPGCGDVVLIEAQSSNKQDLILETVLDCQEKFYIENTATLVTETEEPWEDDAVVEIKLTPTNPETWTKEETAWAKGNTTFTDLGISNKWGWVFDYEIGQNKSQFELWAGAAQNDTSKGTLVGYVEVYNDSDSLYVKYTINEPGWVILKTHLYVGETNPTTADPGQLGYQSGDSGQPVISSSGVLSYTFEIDNGWTDGTDLKLAAHAEVAKYM